MSPAYHPVRRELAAYAVDLARRPELVCLNKVDALGDDAIAAKAEALGEAQSGRCFRPRAWRATAWIPCCARHTPRSGPRAEALA